MINRTVITPSNVDLDPDYNAEKGKLPNCFRLVMSMECAERRAEAQISRRQQERNSFGAPSTTVGRLTSAIRKAAADASVPPRSLPRKDRGGTSP